VDFLISNVLAEAGVSAEGLEGLSSSIRISSLEQGEYLIRQGESAPNLYMIRKGLAKMFYLTPNGKEFVKSFLPEGSFAGSLIAQLEDRSSSFSIVCLEPIELEFIPFSDIQRLFDSDPAALRFGFKLFQELALKKEKREFNFLCLTPEEQYRCFIDENPELAYRVSLADIARYLGITPVALSRIRRRIKQDTTQLKPPLD